MTKENWNKLNFRFHLYLEDSSNKRNVNQPPYIQQAILLKVLIKNKIFKGNDMLDYAGGVGTLSKLLYNYFNIELPIYDPYIEDLKSNVKYIPNSKLESVGVLINSAMFEHIVDRKSLDHINSLVKDDGVLVIHTVICENIPKDPNWFYISPPVHSALHTNNSMKILMVQWGYESSLYCPQAKCWVLFKKEPNNLESIIDKINLEFQTDYLLYKKGFMDYWKGF